MLVAIGTLPLKHPQPPVKIDVRSTTCKVLRFNSQGQLCH